MISTITMISGTGRCFGRRGAAHMLVHEFAKPLASLLPFKYGKEGRSRFRPSLRRN